MSTSMLDRTAAIFQGGPLHSKLLPLEGKPATYDVPVLDRSALDLTASLTVFTYKRDSQLMLGEHEFWIYRLEDPVTPE